MGTNQRDNSEKILILSESRKLKDFVNERIFSEKLDVKARVLTPYEALAKLQANRSAGQVISVYIDFDSLSGEKKIKENSKEESFVNDWRDFIENFRQCFGWNSAPPIFAFTESPYWKTSKDAFKIGCEDIIVTPDLAKHVNGFFAELKTQRLSRMRADFGDLLEVKSGVADESLVSIAATSSSIWICGEEGSGQRSMAQLIHAHSQFSKRSFVEVDLRASNSLSSIIRGDVNRVNASSNAQENTFGEVLKREHGNCGTLYLRGVDCLSQIQQKSLVKVLHELRRQKDECERIRLICSGNKDLRQCIEKEFIIPELSQLLINVPMRTLSLRERKPELLVLSQKILESLARKAGKNVLTLDPEVSKSMLSYNWPGNFNELHNILERACAICWGEKGQWIRSQHISLFQEDFLNRSTTLKEATKRFEREFILKTLKSVQGSKRKAALRLGLSVASLYRKISEIEETEDNWSEKEVRVA